MEFFGDKEVGIIVRKTKLRILMYACTYIYLLQCLGAVGKRIFSKATCSNYKKHMHFTGRACLYTHKQTNKHTHNFKAIRTVWKYA